MYVCPFCVCVFLVSSMDVRLDPISCFQTMSSYWAFQLDYCNSFYFNLPKTQINRRQHIQNSLARTVANTPKYLSLIHI